MQPMLAVAADSPGSLPSGPQWAFEVKWDGVRALADTTQGRLVLRARTGADITVAYPELDGLSVLQGAVLDGEILALVGGVPSFAALTERMHVRSSRRAAELAALTPVTYMVFDVVRLYGVDVARLGYDERRAVLERVELPPQVALSPVYDDGAALWQATAEHGLEGVVAKRRTSPYRPGQRSSDWVKQAHRRTRAALVVGWTRESNGSGRLAALALAAPDSAGRLRYLGRAGSGLAGRLGEVVAGRLVGAASTSCPLAPAEVPADEARAILWCEPVLVADVRYLGRSPTGRLRQPVVRGLRTDADPDPWEAA